MANIAARLDRALRAAGIAITGVSIVEEANRASWKVQPSSLQSAAQPIIDVFNPTDPALDVAELDEQVKMSLDAERLTSAVVWAVIDTYSPPATVAKYGNARTKIITAYKGQPWK